MMRRHTFECAFRGPELHAVGLRGAAVVGPPAALCPQEGRRRPVPPGAARQLPGPAQVQGPYTTLHNATSRAVGLVGDKWD